MNKECPFQMKIMFEAELEGDPAEIAKKRQKLAGYPSAIHSRNKKNHQDLENKHQDQEKNISREASRSGEASRSREISRER